jgi:hypothetical protein
MRFRIAIAFAVLLVAGATAASAQATPDPERAVVRQLMLNLAERVQAGNYAAADSLFPARGGHFLTDTAAFHNWAEYRDKQLKPELARQARVRYAFSGVEAVVRGPVAWVAFVPELGEGAAAVKGRGTAILEKREGRWQIVHMHVSR